MITNVLYKQRAILVQGLRNELPPKLEGLRAPEMVPLMDELVARIIGCWKELNVPIPASEDMQESPAGELPKTVSQSLWSYA